MRWIEFAFISSVWFHCIIMEKRVHANRAHNNSSIYKLTSWWCTVMTIHMTNSYVHCSRAPLILFINKILVFYFACAHSFHCPPPFSIIMLLSHFHSLSISIPAHFYSSIECEMSEKLIKIFAFYCCSVVWHCSLSLFLCVLLSLFAVKFLFLYAGLKFKYN